jgi:tetratricopeptide (TPR) repeat protein
MLSLIHTQNAHRYYNSLAQLYLEKKQLQKSEYYLEKNLGKLELSPNQKQRLAEVYAKNAGKHYREKRYEKAVKQYSNAYKYGSSDTAGLSAVYSLTNIPRQSITSKILNQSTDIFVELLKKYPEDSLAKLTLEEPSSRATRLYYINKLLSFYLAENISPESKIFLEKKKEELQNLAQ